MNGYLNAIDEIPFDQWNHEATNNEGCRLYTKVIYRHTTRGEWKAMMIDSHGNMLILDKLPRILLSSRNWRFTRLGIDIRTEGRQ